MINLKIFFWCVKDHLADDLHDFILVHLGPFVVIENVAPHTDVPNLAYLRTSFLILRSRVTKTHTILFGIQIFNYKISKYFTGTPSKTVD